MTGRNCRIRPRTARMVDGDTLLLRLRDRAMDIRPFGPVERGVIVDLFAGTSPDTLRRRAFQRDGAAGADVADRLLAGLVERGFVEWEPETRTVSDVDAARFERLLDLFSESESQDVSRYDRLGRLRRSSVAIVGLGGLGSWVTYQLLCFGVGHLTLVDPDTVEASNLNRSILFTEDDIGRPKVAVATEAIARFAPRTTVTSVQAMVTAAADLTEAVEGADLVLGLADRPHWLIREWVAVACRDLGIPGLQCGGGRVGPFHIPGRTSCAVCFLTAETRQRPRLAAALRESEGLPRMASGGLSSLGGVMAGFIGHEVFRYLAGLHEPLTLNRAWQLDARDMTSRYVPVPLAPDCTVCGPAVIDDRPGGGEHRGGDREGAAAGGAVRSA